MLHRTTHQSGFSTILSASPNCSVIFAEQCKSLSPFQKETIKALIKDYAYHFGQLDSIELGMELFTRLGLYSTIMFKKHENDVIEVLL